MFNLGEYKRRPGWLPDYLPWAGFVAPGIIVTKFGGFQRTYRYRGPDLDSSTKVELANYSARLNNIFRRFGSDWCIHIDADRYESMDYPNAEWSNRAGELIDNERRMAFQTEEEHHETDYFVTLTYLPPTENTQKLQNFMFEAQPGLKGPTYADHLKTFTDETDDFLNLVKGAVPFAEWLSDDETCTYLHNCISNKRQKLVRAPEPPFYLDALLPDCEMPTGTAPMLGEHHLKVLSVRGFPEESYPALLDILNNLPIAYRWSTRWLPMDRPHATKAIKGMRKAWFSKRKGAASILTEPMTNTKSQLEDPEAREKSGDAEHALKELSGGKVTYGHFTVNVVVIDEDPVNAARKIREIQKLVDNEGFVTKVESFNAVKAWLGTLPGHMFANVRRPPVSSKNLTHLQPSSAIWAGPTWDKHLGGPPLMTVRARGNTPFRLSTHIGDLGHALMIGPTRAGKSFKLALMRQQFKRYKRAKVRVFDKGGSSKVDTLCAGGEFFDLGDPKGIGFQPLRNIHIENELLWANEWLITIVEEEGLEATPDRKADLWKALQIIAKADASLRTMTALRDLVGDPVTKKVLTPFTNDGAYGYLLDRNEDKLPENDWQSFELEKLFGKRSVMGPVLAYLFHRVELDMDGSPMMIQLDEAWSFLDYGGFEKKIKEWLKAMGKRKVHIIFSSQSLDDVMASKIFATLLESCPSRIYLPNMHATEERIMGFYRGIGLNNKQIKLIAEAEPKRDYYFQGAEGNRLYECDAGPITRAICGSSTLDDLQLADEILAAHGKAAFLENFLLRKLPNIQLPTIRSIAA